MQGTRWWTLTLNVRSPASPPTQEVTEGMKAPVMGKSPASSGGLPLFAK